MLKNKFVQAAAVAALVYMLFQIVTWGLGSFLRVVETFARWYRFNGAPWAEETAIAVGLLYLFVAAV